MKKILLIEDRKRRQELFIEDTGIDLSKYSIVLDNRIGENYEKLYAEFKNGTYKLDDYSLIIAHRSAFRGINSAVLDQLKDYCEKTKIPLILFSGGIPSTYYTKNPFEFMLINSKDFYSNNLELFLNDCLHDKFNLQMLAYGLKWKVNFMLNTLEKVNLYICENASKEIVSYEKFKGRTDLDLITEYIQYKQPELKNGGVYMHDLKKISANMTRQIKEQVVLNV